jgi:hypothetical protein
MDELEELRKGIELFNQRAFFECHEVLEDQWRRETGDLKNLYQAIIKIAVGFYHAERKNYVGAVKVLRRGLHQIKPYLQLERTEFLLLEPFVRQCTQCLNELEQAGQGFSQFDMAHVPYLLRWTEPSPKSTPR